MEYLNMFLSSFFWVLGAVTGLFVVLFVWGLIKVVTDKEG